MSASLALQKAIKDRLVAASLSAPVFDNPPRSNPYPRIEFGPTDIVPDNADCLTLREETVQIDVWTERSGKLHPCKAIVDEVYDALHEVSLTLDDPYAAVLCRVALARVFPEPDGIRAHGVVQVTALVETVSSA